MSSGIRNASRILLVALAILVALPATAAHAQERTHRFATLSLWDPISTNADREATTNLRIALIQSYVYGVRGLDITGIAGQLGGDIEGVQITGIYSHVKGGGRGLVFAGFGSYMGDAFTGGQGSLVLNFNRGRFRGLQYSGIANFTADGMSGFQEDVPRFHIAMDHAPLMGKLQSIGGLASDAYGLFQGKLLLALQARPQVLPLHEGHDEIE